jgi:hypothetical protein
MEYTVGGICKACGTYSYRHVWRSSAILVFSIFSLICYGRRFPWEQPLNRPVANIKNNFKKSVLEAANKIFFILISFPLRLTYGTGTLANLPQFSVTPRSRILERLTVSQLFTAFPACYGTRACKRPPLVPVVSNQRTERHCTLGLLAGAVGSHRAAGGSGNIAVSDFAARRIPPCSSNSASTRDATTQSFVSLRLNKHQPRIRRRWPASRPGRFTTEERAPGTHCITGWIK